AIHGPGRIGDAVRASHEIHGHSVGAGFEWLAELDGVDAIATIERIASLALRVKRAAIESERVVPGAAVHGVVPEVAADGVVAVASEDDVVAVAAAERVVADAAVERIAARVAIYRVVAAARG